MDEQVDPDIGRVVGFQTGDLMYIATIISIDDDAEPKNEDTPPESTIEEAAQHDAFW